MLGNFMKGVYRLVAPTLADGDAYPPRVNSAGVMMTDSGAGTAGSPSGGVQTVQAPEDGVALVKAAVTMSGASASLVGADATRKIVIVASTAGNAAAAIDPTGGTAVLTAGLPLAGGAQIVITGKAAQSAMTQIGTNLQLLTVYTG